MYDPEYLASDADMEPEQPKRVDLKDIPEPEGDERTRLWEKNHKKIIEAIKETMGMYKAIPPSVSELARKTGLSRQTIYEHMRDFKYHPAQVERNKMFDLMKFEVMMRLCNSALSGNFKAMKLYLQMTGANTVDKK
jgi:hypothetical protein